MTDAIGMLSAHMLQHLLLMNLVAPALAVAARRRLPVGLGRSWPLATALQMVLLWSWHLPGVLEGTMQAPLGYLAMQGTLFLAALWFWSTVVALSGQDRWRAIIALGVTGKLFCLLGALLVFAPRVLFGAASHHGGITVADQQLAGLIMIVACPITYVLAGIIVSALWFHDIEKVSGLHDRTAAPNLPHP